MPPQTSIRHVRRTTARPSAGVPFGARTVGHYFIAPGFHGAVRAKSIVQCFWGIKGSGIIMIEGAKRRLNPGQVAVYLPGMRHDWFGERGLWEFRWWTMDGPLAESTATALGLVGGIYEAGPAPVALFRRLEKVMVRPSRKDELTASAIAYQLLTLAASRPMHLADQYVKAAIEMIHREWNRPDLNVKTLAYALHRPVDQLSHDFQKSTGISPKKYILNLRIQNALALLQQTAKPVAEVASHCGYADPNYFSRLIHRLTGQSCREFRAQHRTA